ncbi:MAG: hypothetical protein ACJASQ_003081 [Crocinitomicaceae bacterium]|jgi:hypothetical protein
MSEIIKKEQEFVNANIIKASIEHNGYGGGNHSHGGYVELKIQDLSSTNMLVDGKEASKFTLMVKGDSERETLLQALKMFVTELEQNS